MRHWAPLTWNCDFRGLIGFNGKFDKMYSGHLSNTVTTVPSGIYHDDQIYDWSRISCYNPIRLIIQVVARQKMEDTANCQHSHPVSFMTGRLLHCCTWREERKEGGKEGCKGAGDQEEWKEEKQHGEKWWREDWKEKKKEKWDCSKNNFYHVNLSHVWLSNSCFSVGRKSRYSGSQFLFSWLSQLALIASDTVRLFKQTEPQQTLRTVQLSAGYIYTLTGERRISAALEMHAGSTVTGEQRPPCWASQRPTLSTPSLLFHLLFPPRPLLSAVFPSTCLYSHFNLQVKKKPEWKHRKIFQKTILLLAEVGKFLCG